MRTNGDVPDPLSGTADDLLFTEREVRAICRAAIEYSWHPHLALHPYHRRPAAELDGVVDAVMEEALGPH